MVKAKLTSMRYNTLSEALSLPPVVAELEKSGVGQTVLANQGDRDAAGNDLSGVRETVQEHSEKFLNEELAKVWSIWQNRENFRGQISLTLYKTRNRVFGINPSSIRKLIPGRYILNIEALEAILATSKRPQDDAFC